MKSGNCLRKTMLFGSILLIGFIGSVYCSRTADASTAAGMQQEEVVTGEAIEAVSSQLYPVRLKAEDEYRYGYIDETGKMMIQPVYLDAADFSEGYAVVYNGEKYQFIDQKGNVIFETGGSVQSFHNGLAAFSDPENNYKQGYINTEGKIVIKPVYAFAGEFQEDATAIVGKSEKYYKISKSGKVLKTYQPDSKYYVYQITSDGYIIVSDPDTFKKGVINPEGKIILKPLYGEITYLGSDLFGVKKAVPDYEQYLLSIKPSAIFNQKGNRLTAYQYCDLSSFEGDYASATDSRYTYLIDKSGKKVSGLPQFEGRGSAVVLGDVIRADINYEMKYYKKDGTLIWENDSLTKLSSGITVSTVTLRPNKYAVIHYPLLTGCSNLDVQKAINKKLKNIFTESRKNLKEEDYLSVTDSFTVKQIKNLLIVNQIGYDYPVGAAHGTPLRFYYFIDTKTGDFYQLKDLFKNNSEYVLKLSKIVNKQIVQQSKSEDAIYYFDNNITISKDQYFYVDSDKLTIYFDCGAIAANACGFPEFEISWKDIASIIDKTGAFWKAFH